MKNIILKKIQKQNLTEQEIQYVVSNYINKTIPDYQMAAFLSAIVINGLNDDETFALTKAMINSGSTIVWDENLTIVDKHSTGGVGDKTSLILLPILGSLGIKVAKASGKGLGFTGGTLDKLASIDNFNYNLSLEKFKQQVHDFNIALMGQTDEFVPADKFIYELRDATATVNSIPLIASSIMSKKIALGTNIILLDIKCGSGAFMKNFEDAKKLAKMLQNIGQRFNKTIKIEITSMAEPLGQMIGNKNEVLEAINFLQNKPCFQNLVEVVYSSLTTILVTTKKVKNKDEAIGMISKVIIDGSAYQYFKKWIEIQNGELETFNWIPQYSLDIIATNDGYLKYTNVNILGEVATILGAGRQKKLDLIDYEAGIKLHYQFGDKIIKNEAIMTLYSSKPIDKSLVMNKVLDSFVLEKKSFKPENAILLSF
ncbi:MAG: thymidine phosphorylase [Mycoplasma sp.]|nr:thymidine phosphorylase [Mycoplasma sp.]